MNETLRNAPFQVVGRGMEGRVSGGGGGGAGGREQGTRPGEHEAEGAVRGSESLL